MKYENKYQLGAIYIPPVDFSQKLQPIIDEMTSIFDSQYNAEPHITLHACKFPYENFPMVIEKLQKIAPQKFKLKISDFWFKADRDPNVYYCKLIIERNPSIIALHEQIIETVNPYRNGLIRVKDEERLKTNFFSPRQKELLLKYGYYYIKELFNPHFSIGNITNNLEKMDDFLKRNKKQIDSFIDQELRFDKYEISMLDEKDDKHPIKNYCVELK